MKTALVTLALSLAVSCCKPASCPSVTPDGDAGSVDAAEHDLDAVKLDDCARACATMRLPSIRCPEADPVDAGDSCETVCRHVATTGLTDLKPKCIASAKTVEEVRACGTVRCKR